MLPSPMELAPWAARLDRAPPLWAALMSMAAGLCWQYPQGRAPRWDPTAWAELRRMSLPMVCHATYAAYVADYNHAAAERYLKAHLPKSGH